MIILKTDNLKKLMEKESLNQKTLAERLGLCRSCINRHLHKTRHPSAKFIGAVRESFPEYSFDYFFTLSGAEKVQKATKKAGA